MVNKQGQLTLFRNNSIKYERKISEIIDIESQLDKFNNGKVDLIKVKKKMYDSSLLSKSNIIQTLAERKISCVSDNDQIELPVILPENWQQIKKLKMSQVHIGLVMIGIKGLHRKNLGTKTLVILQDTRWDNLSKSIIGSFEIDMNNNGAIIYFIPDFILDIQECIKHLKIGIKTKGYEMSSGSLNLRITTGFIGKMQIHSNIKFRLNTQELEKILASQGIKAIEGKRYNSETYAGLEWNLSREKEKATLLPAESTSYEYQDGRISLRFSDYQTFKNLNESEDDFESMQSELEK